MCVWWWTIDDRIVWDRDWAKFERWISGGLWTSYHRSGSNQCTSRRWNNNNSVRKKIHIRNKLILSIAFNSHEKNAGLVVQPGLCTYIVICSNPCFLSWLIDCLIDWLSGNCCWLKAKKSNNQSSERVEAYHYTQCSSQVTRRVRRISCAPVDQFPFHVSTFWSFHGLLSSSLSLNFTTKAEAILLTVCMKRIKRLHKLGLIINSCSCGALPAAGL